MTDARSALQIKLARFRLMLMLTPVEHNKALRALLLELRFPSAIGLASVSTIAVRLQNAIERYGWQTATSNYRVHIIAWPLGALFYWWIYGRWTKRRFNDLFLSESHTASTSPPSSMQT